MIKYCHLETISNGICLLMLQMLIHLAKVSHFKLNQQNQKVNLPLKKLLQS